MESPHNSQKQMCVCLLVKNNIVDFSINYLEVYFSALVLVILVAGKTSCLIFFYKFFI